MAEVLRLASSDQSELYNLLSGPIRLARGGFEPKTAGPDDEWISEALSLVGSGSPAELRSAENAIHDLAELALEHGRDPVAYLGSWLEWNLEGESPKRAYLRDLRLALNQPNGSRGAFLDLALFGSLGYTRRALWENVTAETASTSSLSNNGGSWDLSAESAYSGNAPGRIEKLALTVSTTLKHLWVGIRDYRRGVSDFDPVFTWADGTGGTDTSSQTDALAVSGTALECTFSTVATEYLRARIRLDDVLASGSYDHFVGRYLVLGRLRCDSSTQAWVRISSGFVGSGVNFGPRIVVEANTGGYWALELGTIQIPPGFYEYGLSSHFSLDDFMIELYAERLSGSGSLWLDELILIPLDHFAKMSSAGNSVTTGYFFTNPDDRTWADGVDAVTETAIGSSFRSWSMPRAPGVLVVASATEGGHNDALTFSASLNYFPRWRVYRT